MVSALEQYEKLARVEFDHPFRVGHSGTLYDDVPGVHAPEVFHDDERDVDILDDDWVPFSTGYTGQYSYNGPVMHASETLSGGLADDILATPGVYVVCAVEVWPDEDDREPFPAGWIVLQHKEGIR